MFQIQKMIDKKTCSKHVLKEVKYLRTASKNILKNSFLRVSLFNPRNTFFLNRLLPYVSKYKISLP